MVVTAFLTFPMLARVEQRPNARQCPQCPHPPRYFRRPHTDPPKWPIVPAYAWPGDLRRLARKCGHAVLVRCREARLGNGFHGGGPPMGISSFFATLPRFAEIGTFDAALLQGRVCAIWGPRKTTYPLGAKAIWRGS